MHWAAGDVVVGACGCTSPAVGGGGPVLLLPGGHDVRIDGAGHGIHCDQFGAFVAAVGPFLDPARPA